MTLQQLRPGQPPVKIVVLHNRRMHVLSATVLYWRTSPSRLNSCATLMSTSIDGILERVDVLEVALLSVHDFHERLQRSSTNRLEQGIADLGAAIDDNGERGRLG
jgi:hypothetical protein